MSSPLHKKPSSRHSPKKQAALIVVLLILVFIAAWATRIFSPGDENAIQGTSVFQGISNHPDQSSIPISMKCGACHADIFRQWADSDHAWAHRGLNPKYEAEAFHDSPLSAHGTNLDFSTNDSGERIITDKTTGQVWKIDMAIGRRPLVQFLTKGSDGGYHTTSAAWDVERKEWFDMFGTDQRSPGDWGHWTGRGMIWNTQCAWCHMSGFQKNYNVQSHKYHSTWKEPGVTCIQCHGPLLSSPEESTGCLVNTKTRYSLKQVSDNCATCHSRRDELDHGFRMGEKFEDHFLLNLPTQPGLYWANGMQRDEVYTETGLKLSRMGKAGVQCIDCHNAHTAELKFPQENNRLCLQCHESGERNAPVIKPLEHSKHKNDSMGNRCVECHMPHTTYMERDPRRDHSFCSPDPLLTRELGIPNSCNQCHTDKSLEWAEQYVKEWYGKLPLTNRRSRTRAVHEALEGSTDVLPALLSAWDAEENPTWRATLLELMDVWPDHPEVGSRAVTASKSEHYLERVAAARILGQIKSTDIMPLLTDPVKSVRVQAAWGLRDMLPENAPAMKELEASAIHQADQPGGAMKLAQIYASRALMKQPPGGSEAQWNKNAEYWFLKAREWDPTSAVVRRDFAVFLASQNKGKEAVQELEKAIELEPRNAQLYYLLALSYAESHDQTKAIHALDTAIELEPAYARAAYNRALIKNETGKLDEALEDLDLADKMDGRNPEYLYTKAILLYQKGRLKEARQVIAKLNERFPGFEPARQLIKEMR